MINDNYGLDATVKLSEDKNDNGDFLMLLSFKPKPEIDKERKFEENSYLSLGEKENVILSHVINYDEAKTLYKEAGKTTFTIIFNTHVYAEKADVKKCFEVYARAMQNIDNWIKIPKHDATSKKFLSALST